MHLGAEFSAKPTAISARLEYEMRNSGFCAFGRVVKFYSRTVETEFMQRSFFIFTVKQSMAGNFGQSSEAHLKSGVGELDQQVSAVECKASPH